MFGQPSCANLLCTRSGCIRSGCTRSPLIDDDKWKHAAAAGGDIGSNASTAATTAAGSAGECEGASGGMEQVCVQAEGSQRSDQWVFVGPGQRRYETSPAYSYVGKGNGGFEQTQPTAYRGWRFTNCCVRSTGISLASAFLCFLLQCIKSGTFGTQFHFAIPSVNLAIPSVNQIWNIKSVPTSAPVPTLAPTTEAYDCYEKGLWSLARRTWCCDNYDQRCTTPPPPATQPPPRIVVLPVLTPASAKSAPASSTLHATSKVQTGSSFSSLAAATAAAQVAASGATTSPLFNCLAGAANWRIGWSRQKKAWCCKTLDVGCVTSQATLQLATTTTHVPDCRIALFNWRAAWSEAKKDYCCRYEGKGCMKKSDY